MKRLLAVVAGVALAGCEPSPRPDPASTQAPAAASPDAQAPGAGRATDPHEEIAPLVLTLTPLSEDGNTLVLQANLDAPAALPLPVDLIVDLPPGAKLLEGVDRDIVPVEKGRTSRTFRIERADTTSPIKVIARVTHPKKAWGIYAAKTFPEAPKAAGFVPASKPPLARPANPMLRSAKETH